MLDQDLAYEVKGDVEIIKLNPMEEYTVLMAGYVVFQGLAVEVMMVV